MKQENEHMTTLDEQHLGDLLRHMGPRPQPSSEAMEAARSNVKTAWRQAVAENRSRRQRAVNLSLAASVLLLLGVTFGITRTPPLEASGMAVVHYAINAPQIRLNESTSWQELPEEGRINIGDTLRLGPDAYALLTLDDGLEMRLDGGSEVEFIAQNRLYLHTGALYADAPGDATLTVETPRGIARDIGTRFEVRLLDDSWSVQVRDGKVLVDDKHLGQAVAEAGERLSVAAHGFDRQSISPADASWHWTYKATEPLAIDGQTLQTYLSWWSRESGLVIEFAKPIDAAIASQTLLHGDLEHMTMQQGFDAVLASSGYAVVDRDDRKVILTR